MNAVLVSVSFRCVVVLLNPARNTQQHLINSSRWGATASHVGLGTELSTFKGEPTELRRFTLNHSVPGFDTAFERADESMHDVTPATLYAFWTSVNIKMQKDGLNMNPACSVSLGVYEWQRPGFVYYTNTEAHVNSRWCSRGCESLHENLQFHLRKRASYHTVYIHT